MTETGAQAHPLTDPRPLYGAAMDQVAALVPAATGRLDGPTPCGEWSVRQLIGHIVAGGDRATAAGQGRDVGALPVVVDGVADDGWIDALASARGRAEATWSDDQLLTRFVRVPWGEVPGAIAIGGYVQEAATHAWDLATATGQLDRLDPGLGAAALAIAHRALPAQPRGGQVPFAPVVDVDDGADAWAHLAGWLGRRP